MDSALYHQLDAFICHCERDNALLRDICKRCGVSMQHFTTFITNFDTPPHQIPADKLPRGGFRSVRDLLVCAHPFRNVIMNLLIDQVTLFATHHLPQRDS